MRVAKGRGTILLPDASTLALVSAAPKKRTNAE
jgi:hypothetical protein